MYVINNSTRELFYSGGAKYDAKLTINGTQINQGQISKIVISNPFFDNTSQTFYLGQFVSQQIEIYFNDTNGIATSGNVELSIGVKSDISTSEYEYIPIGKYIIDSTEEDYYKNKKLVCLDYGIKLKPNVDYSSLIIDEDGNITPISLETLLQWLCTHFGVELGTYPTVNKDYLISTYDNTLSGKYYVSLIAELMGGMVAIDRTGKLNIVPIKQNKVITRNATKNESWEYTNTYTISAVEYNNGTIYAHSGTNTNNTLYIRSTNMFVLDDYEDLIENIYNAVVGTTICSLKTKQPCDLSLDRWDLVEFDLDGEKILTYNNNTITYEMSIMSEINTQIPSKNQETTTNQIKTSDSDKIRKLQVEINQEKLEIKQISKEIGDREEKETSITQDIDQVTIDINKVTKDVNETIVINNTISNYPIEIQNAGVYNLETNIISGNSEQESTPTPTSPSEIKSVGQKNLLKLIDGTYTHRGITAVVENGKITLNGTATSNTSFVNVACELNLNKGITYKHCAFNNENLDYTGDGSRLESTSGSANILWVDFSVKNSSSTKEITENVVYDKYIIRTTLGKSYNNYVITPMVAENSYDYSYVHYGNNIVEKTNGKNLLNKDKWSNAYISNTGVITTINYQALFDYVKVKPNTKYTISLNSSIGAIFVVRFNKSRTFIDRVSTTYNKQFTFETTSSTEYIRVFINKDSSTTITQSIIDSLNIQLEKGENATTYEAYNENKITYSLNKKNLFDKNNANTQSIVPDTTSITSSSTAKSFILKIKPNTNYIVKRKVIGKRFVVGTTKNEPIVGETILDRVVNNSGEIISFKSNENANYLIVYYLYNNEENENNILSNMFVYESSESFDYFELNKIGDTYNELDIKNGILTKRIGKIQLNGSETISYNSANQVFYTSIDNVDITNDFIPMSNYFVGQSKINSFSELQNNKVAFRVNTSSLFFKNTNITSLADFKTWLSNNKPIIYYILEEPETIQLDKTDLMLLKGYNLISLDSEVEPSNMNIVYLTNSILNSQYVNQTQLKADSDKILIEVGETITKYDTELKDDLSQTYGTKEEYKEGSLPVGYVKIGAKYEFGKDGLKITSEDGYTSSKLDDKGLDIQDDIGNQILYAGYDDKYSSSILKTQKMIINDKLRFENYTTENNEEAVGCFWVGD